MLYCIFLCVLPRPYILITLFLGSCPVFLSGRFSGQGEKHRAIPRFKSLPWLQNRTLTPSTPGKTYFKPSNEDTPHFSPQEKKPLTFPPHFSPTRLFGFAALHWAGLRWRNGIDWNLAISASSGNPGCDGNPATLSKGPASLHNGGLAPIMITRATRPKRRAGSRRSDSGAPVPPTTFPARPPNRRPPSPPP